MDATLNDTFIMLKMNKFHKAPMYICVIEEIYVIMMEGKIKLQEKNCNGMLHFSGKILLHKLAILSIDKKTWR